MSRRSQRWACLHSENRNSCELITKGLRLAPSAHGDSLMKYCLIFSVVIFGLCGDAFGQQTLPKARPSLEPFLKEYCVGCHGPKRMEGQVRFDKVAWEITTNDVAQRWQDVLDQLNGGDMPPEDAKKTARMVKLSRREMLDEVDEYREITERYEHADNSLMESAAAVTLLDVGIPIKAKDFGPARADWESATFRNDNAKVGVETLMGRMLIYDALYADTRIIAVNRRADCNSCGKTH